MKPNSIHQSIAQQIDHMKPDHMVPGKNVGMEILNETSLRVGLLDDRGFCYSVTTVELDEGADLYNVQTITRTTATEPWSVGEKIEGVFCDQLGEFVFGDDAKPWTQKFGEVVSFNADGSVASRSEF